MRKAKGRAKMPWHGDIAHTKLSDGRVVLRGSPEEAEHMYGDLVTQTNSTESSQTAQFPHCNSEVLHAPGTCQYCDLYPDRQSMRAASNTPFTPAEANGWYGNVAQKAE